MSFRDLADRLGIKSASVHYHFRQKEDLGTALVARYSERFFAALEVKTADARTPADRLRAFCAVYRDALVSSDRICLCGILGAESSGLPKPVAQAVERFFEANIAWVSRWLPDDRPEGEARAVEIVSALQGAMMLATSMKTPALFDKAVEALFRDV